MTFAVAALVLLASPARAFHILVSNEKDNTVTVLDGDSLKIIKTVAVGARPRGIVLSADGKSLYICTSDADHIEVLDLATLTVKRILPSGADPEYMALSHDGKTLYIANEDNSQVSVLDVASGRITSEIPVGVEPEGMAVSPDDKTVICTSETTSMAHFIDVATHKVTASVLVGTRPRFAAFTKDGSKVWISSEVAGTVAVIDTATHKVLQTIHFDLPEVPKAAIQAVGINLTADGRYAFVDLGPANRVAVIDPKTYEVKKYLLVGQRVWHNDFSPDQKFLYTANGISNDMSVIDINALDVTQSVPVGQSPWGVVVAPDTLPALAVTKLSYAFGPRRVLHDVDITVQPGDFAVLLGLNGAGKTTLFALVTRLYSARMGKIAVFGNDIEKHPLAALACLSVVFQQSTLDLDLTIEQNLYYHAALHGMKRSDARIRITEELGRINLLDRAKDRVRALSGGQKRRVELARALLHNPSLLLLDEPTVGLDIESRQFLLQHVKHLCKTQNLGVLWATHLIDEADTDSKIIVLHQGKILAQGQDITQNDETLKQTFDRLTRKKAA